MLKALELENFKAFGQRNRIEFAPITLIFGENSAGKSSLLQAMNLLKQTRESREHGALLLPRTEGGIVELGGYREMVFDHDMSREISVRIDFMTERGMPNRFSESKGAGRSTSNAVGFEVRFSRPSEDVEIQLKSLTLHAETFGKIAIFEPIELPASELRQVVRDSLPMMRSRRPMRLSEVRAAQCTWLTEDTKFWADIYARTKRRADKITQELQQLQSDTQESTQQKSLFNEAEDGMQRFADEIDRAISFYESDFSIEEFVSRMRKAEVNSVIGLDGFVPLPMRSGRRDSLPEFETFRKYGPTRLRMRDLTLDVSGFAVEYGRMLEVVLENIYPMGPFRRPPERWYIFTGTSPQDVGYRGDLLPDLLFRHPKLVEDTNVWLDRLEVGYHVRPQSVGTRTQDLFEVRLIDKRRGGDVEVSLSDVGFGVSQLLPFVVQALAGERQIITIEQPEVHIHPRLQADLGDLLIATIQDPRSHRFIIETHSEHLILRLLRRIRQTNAGELPDGHPGLKPEDVSVIYLERTEAGTQAHHLRVDETGDFVDRWPKGFFEERAKELF